MMSSLVYGLDICVQGGDVRVSTGRCFIFVMKYIKLTYIRAGIMFISVVVVECLYLIHWKRCKNGGRGWRETRERRLPVLVVSEWLKHGDFIVSRLGVAYSAVMRSTAAQEWQQVAFHKNMQTAR